MSVTPPYYDPISNLNLADTFYTWYRRTNDIVQKLNPLELYGITASTVDGFDGLNITYNDATGIATIGYVLPYTIPNDHKFTGGITFAGDIIVSGGVGASFFGPVLFEPSDDANHFITFRSGNVQFEDGVNKVDFFTPNINIIGSANDPVTVTIDYSDINIDNTDIDIDLATNKNINIFGDANLVGTTKLFDIAVPSIFGHHTTFDGLPTGESPSTSTVEFTSETTIDAACDTVNFHTADNQRQLIFSGNNVTFSGDQATWTFNNAGGVKFGTDVTHQDDTSTTFEDRSELHLEGKVFDSDGAMPGAGHVLITDTVGKLKYGDKQFIWNTDMPGLGTSNFAANYVLGNMAWLAKVGQGYRESFPRYYVFSRRTLLPNDYTSNKFGGAFHGGLTFHKGLYSIIRAYGASGSTNLTPMGSWEPDYQYVGFGGTMSTTFAKILACGGYKTFGTPFAEMGITFRGLTGCSDQRMKDKYWYADVNIYENHTDPDLSGNTMAGGDHYTWVKSQRLTKTRWSSNMRVNPNYYESNSSRGWSGAAAGEYLENGIPLVPDSNPHLSLNRSHSTQYFAGGHRNNAYTFWSPEIVYEDPVDLIGAEQIGQFGGAIPAVELPVSHSPYMFNVKLKYSVPGGMRLIMAFQVDSTNGESFRKNAFDNYPYHRDDSEGSLDANVDAISDSGEFRQVIYTPNPRVPSETFGGDDSNEIRRFIRIKMSDFVKKMWKFGFKYVTNPDANWSYRNEWESTPLVDNGGLVSDYTTGGSPPRVFRKEDFDPASTMPIPYMTDPPSDSPNTKWTANKGMSIITEALEYGGQLLADDYNTTTSWPNDDGSASFQTLWITWIKPDGNNDTGIIHMHSWNEIMARLAKADPNFSFGTYGVTGCGRDENGDFYGTAETVPDGVLDEMWKSLNHDKNKSRLYHDGPYARPRSETEPGYGGGDIIGPDMGYWDRVIRYQLRNANENINPGIVQELERVIALPRIKDKTQGDDHEVIFGWGYFGGGIWYPEKLMMSPGVNLPDPRITTSFIDPLTGGGTATGVVMQNGGTAEIVPWERVRWWSDNQPTTPFTMPNSKAAFDWFGELPAVTGDIYGTHTMGGVGSATGKRNNVELRAFFNDNNSAMFSPFKNTPGATWSRWAHPGWPRSKNTSVSITPPPYDRTSTWGSGWIYFNESQSDLMVDQYPVGSDPDYTTEFAVHDHYGNTYVIDNFNRGVVKNSINVNETRARYIQVDLDFTDIEPVEVNGTFNTDQQQGELLLQIPAPVGGIIDNNGFVSHPLFLKSKIIAMDISDEWKKTPNQIWQGVVADTSDANMQASQIPLRNIDDSEISGETLIDDGETRRGNTGSDGNHVDDHKIYAVNGRYEIRFTGTSITIQR